MVAESPHRLLSLTVRGTGWNPARSESEGARPPALPSEPGLARGVRLPPPGRPHVARLVPHRAARRGSGRRRGRAADGLPASRGDGRAQLHLDHGRPARRRPVPAGAVRRVGRVRRDLRAARFPRRRRFPVPLALRPREAQRPAGAIGEAGSLLSAATALIESSDQLDLQGNGLLDFAEVRELAGAPDEAAALCEQAAALFERKGNVVSGLRARELAERLRAR